MHHILTLLPPAWGHAVSYLHLAIQMLKADPTLVISIVQHNLVVAQMEKELASCAYDTSRLRILGVGNKDTVFSPTAIDQMLKELLGGWTNALPELAIGTPQWPKPQSIHFDFTAGGMLVRESKAIMGPTCKILMWFATAGLTLKAHINDYDWSEICETIYADESRRAGRTREEIGIAIATACNGSDKVQGVVVRNPGAPDMYDYERVSLAAGVPRINFLVFTAAMDMARLVDGYILCSGAFFEPVGIPHLREFYKNKGQEIFAIGLQSHERYFTEQPEPTPISNETVKGFLDAALRNYGKNSALYISFGSLFFPIATPKHVEGLIDTLLSLDQPFPFIFALGGAMASLPAETIERVNSSGKGLICAFWVEQRAILQHEAVGWFLTHGGFNSITESLLLGLPSIVWPAGAEQPVNAAFLSAEPNPVAIELLQIRTGAQVGPSLRHGDSVKITGTVDDAVKEFRSVFADARGEKGERLRENAKMMAQRIREGRRGEAAREIERLTKFGL
ncbi:hypothetical protein MIND_00803300 [Mycena indigotica]|uniref:UDP-Glycosyltransferase/glycogen phosphorylase n=1 Tax=Mycena indigotica TaxID=2126181 RepID=A0A8H6SFH9_9AGAR|nr:uncharacterized protein MIND_00803300 [Mycena indigotica]KAF7298566.1 hypothetical protein MIND_00803300 [Mycena indigotica]